MAIEYTKKSIDVLLKNLKEIRKFSDNEIEAMFKEKELSIPISAFQNRNLGMLESAVYYLKNEKKLSNREIADLMNRSNKTIWTSYNKALKKLKRK